MTASSDPQPVTNRLARFVCATRWDEVPPAIRHAAKRSLMNYFACALAGCRDPAVEATAGVLKLHGGCDAATVIGRGERADALSATFLNAASANVFDFDDTHAPTIIHPTAPVAPALFALAEASPVRGADLLLAFVLGVEAECRIGNAISPAHYRRGWHITSTCGVFGAAAAAGRVLGLSVERMTWALGNASAQSGGLLETLGTMGKSISVGNAARNGLVAALYAQAGVAGPAAPLEGRYGFLRVVDEAPACDRITEGLGAHWALELNMYKPYPCGVVLNPVLDACFELAAEHALDGEEVARVEIAGHPLLRERTDRVHPLTGREAQVSAQHSVAVAFMRRAAGLAEYTDACAADPTLRALRERVCFVDEPAYAVDAATVTVTLRSGACLSRHVEHARGSTARPLSDGDLEHKLRELVRHGGSNCDPDPLIAAIWSLDTADSAARLMSLASGRRPHN